MKLSSNRYRHFFKAIRKLTNVLMSASNDELLYYAACEGDLKKVEELLSRGAGTGFRDGVR